MIHNRLVLIDAYALIFRAYFSIPPHFTDKTGRPTNAVYGFASALLSAIKDLHPEYLAIGIDVGKSVRHQDFAQYKAHRPPVPDDLKAQVPIVYELAEAMNIPMFGVEGYEGEDVIATIVAKLSDFSNQTSAKSGSPKSESGKLMIESIIVTGDMDCLQLIDGSTLVYSMARGAQHAVMYDTQKVQERYGVTPHQFVDYKALKGDASDNIPGVPGIGEKTAADLIARFETLGKLYGDIEKSFQLSDLRLRPNEEKTKNAAKELKISEKVIRLLIEHKEQAFLSQKLATILRDVPIDFKLQDARVHDYDLKKVMALFQELGFKSLIPRLPIPEKIEEVEKPSPQQSLF